MLLLHLMCALFPQQVRAIYVNHQLQGLNAAWGEFVYAQAEQLGVALVIEKVDVQAGNVEQQARVARYQAYQKHLNPNEVLVLAHHEQDQAETVLLRLFSGSGVSGLAAMRELDQREQLTIWRPFLTLSRQQIATWCHRDAIDYVEDPSNLDTHYDRAWCRQLLWPMLESRFAHMQAAVARSSQLMQDADEILNEVLAQDLSSCGNGNELNLKQLASLSAARRRQLLSNWMKGEAEYRPSFAMVARLEQEVIAAKADRQAALHCNGYYYLRYQQRLFRLEKADYLAQQHQIPTQVLKLKYAEPLELAAGKFRLQATTAVGLAWELLEQDLTLTARQGGEKIHLYGRVGSWPLKKAIQDAQIYPWQRHTIQILSRDNVMLGVFSPQGFWLAHSVYCEPGGWLPNLVSEITSN